jgi:hypothetical protein
MALVKLGGIVGDIRGAIGASVFSRNRFGGYIRNRAIPVNPATTRQENVRIAMNQLQYRFRETLTAAQKLSWDNYAAGTPTLNRLGDQIHPTAINFYLRANIIYLLYGGTPIDTAPSTPGIAAIPTLIFTGTDATGVVLDEPDPVLDTGDVLQIQVSPAKPFSVNFFKGPFTVTFYFDDATAFPQIIVPIAQTVIGQRYFMQGRVVRADGRVSNTFLYRQDITT